MFSKRTDWSFQVNNIAACLDRVKAQSNELFDLTVSNPTQVEISYPQQELLQSLSRAEVLEYQPSPQGLLSAREALASFYTEQGYQVHPEQIYLTASTSEAYSFLFRLLADSSEQIYFPKPSYPLFDFISDIHDVKNCYYPLLIDKGLWKMDTAALLKLGSAKARAVVCVHPNNPTGSYVSSQEQDSLSKLCQQQKLALICDEVFFPYALDEQQARSFLSQDQALTFVLGGLSKAMGLPQMKLSWIIINGPANLCTEARKRLDIISDTFLSVNTPVQQALPAWLKVLPEIQNQIHKRVKSNLEELRRQVSTADIGQVLPAGGGWYAILHLPGLKDEEALVLKLLKQEAVYVHPGFFYDFEQEGYLVVSLLPQESCFRAGVARLLTAAQDFLS